MKTLQLAILFLVILFFIQCEEIALDQDKQYSFGDTITISLHDTVFIENMAYQVRFDSVLMDSRCPIDVVCVWQGEVKTNVTVADLDESETFLLGFYEPWKEPTVTFKDISITFLGLLPNPILEADSLEMKNPHILILVKELQE